ncbi:LAME_0F08020g1_1 [Lachancea meyersii CBS 8951]|uniref:LAME_0F08020g1_1 n=1 Tax=Lachancea meyersii CBS 8951 TaxID=1266667 RepID=A0A1G4JUE6_9SACH|nr:LAME_0F08020g1_1 [Lachancea meyersii CBS 8951]
MSPIPNNTLYSEDDIPVTSLSLELAKNAPGKPDFRFDEIFAPDCSTPLSSADVLEDFGRIRRNRGRDDGESKSVEGGGFGDFEITALAGAMAGFLAGVTVCPLDVAKTRLQAQGLRSGSVKYYNGIVGTLTTIVRDEGVRGLYKGLVPIIMGYFPTWMIYFTVYEKSKKRYPQLFPSSDFLSHSLSALTAGSVSTILTNPVWVVKTRLMLQTHVDKNTTHYKGTFDAFYKIYTTEGFKTFYAGLLPSLFGLFHVAIHFPIYEKLKVWLHCSRSFADFEDHKLDIARLITASSVSKMVASTLTYPHEILRTRMQLKAPPAENKNALRPTTNHGLIRLVSCTYKAEGLKGFYSGFTTNLVRTVPASAITLVSFEYFRKYLTNLSDSLTI